MQVDPLDLNEDQLSVNSDAAGTPLSGQPNEGREEEASDGTDGDADGSDGDKSDGSDGDADGSDGDKSDDGGDADGSDGSDTDATE